MALSCQIGKGLTSRRTDGARSVAAHYPWMTDLTASTAARIAVAIDLAYEMNEPGPVLMQIEAAALPDQVIISSALSVDPIPGFRRIAAHGEIGERIWLMPEDHLAARYRAEIAISRPAPVLEDLRADELQWLPSEAVEYIFPSRYCPVDTLHAAAIDMFGHLSGGAAVAAVRDWIGSHLSYVPGASHVGTTALDTFHAREGVCRDYAHLLIALSRVLGIPARMVSALAPGVNPPDFHAVAQVWLEGRWHLVDATGMADPSQTAIIGVGRDASDVAFLTIFGAATLERQSVEVTLL